MIQETDIIIESDLVIESGDIAIKDCTNQNIKHLLIATPGNYYNHPKTGAMLYKWQNAALTDWREFEARIKQTLEADGYVNVEIKGDYNQQSNTSTLNVTANRD